MHISASPPSLPSWPPPSPAVRLRRAVRVALTHWRLAIALYLPNLLLALLAAVPAFFGMMALASLGHWAALVASGGYAEVLLEAAIALSASQTLPRNPPPAALSSAGHSLLLAGILALFGLVAQGLAYTFVVGGILDRLAGPTHPISPSGPTSPTGLPGLAGAPEPSFWRACRDWFWPMLRFGLLAGTVWIALAGLGLAAIGLIGENTSSSLPLKALIALIWLACINGLLEFGRAGLVMRRDRSALRALGQALGAPIRPRFFGGAILLWLVLAAAGLTFGGAWAGLSVAVPATSILIALAVQQLAAFVGAWLKLLRLAVAVELAQVLVGDGAIGDPGSPGGAPAPERDR